MGFPAFPVEGKSESPIRLALFRVPLPDPTSVSMPKLRKPHPLGRRGLQLESLESRVLLASDGFHNFLAPHDVNDDGRVSAIDALKIVNHLGRGSTDDTKYFEDVNDDGNVTTIDALHVIHAMSRGSSHSGATDEAIARLYRDDGVRAQLEFEVEGSKSKLEIKVQNADAHSSYEVLISGVSIGQLETNGRGRGELEFGSDDDALPMPANLPAIGPGTSVTIVGLGEFQFGSTSSGHNDDASTGEAIELKAQLTGVASINAQAEYERTSQGAEFSAKVLNAEASSSYEVRVDGVSVGTLRTDEAGRGRLQFELNDDSKPFPADFPSITVGTEVRIGQELVGTFRLDDSSSNGDDSGDDSSRDEIELIARLSGLASINAWAKFEGTETNIEFKVELRDAPADTSYAVLIDGVSVGILRTDSSGRGRLQFEQGDDSRPFPDGFPPIIVGTQITVGDQLTGSFALDSSDD